MQDESPKRIIGPALFICAILTGVALLSIRATRTDVDASVAQIREDHTCSYCGHVFSLAISDAAAMRRAQGDIICPKCGKRGAVKDASASAADLTNPLAPPSELTESNPEADASPDSPKPTRPSPAATREKNP